MAEMTNIDIRDFITVQGVEDGDYVVLSLSGGSSGKMAVGLLRSSMSSGIAPSIKEGTWWVGSTDTGIRAEGETPQLRRGEMGIEYKYPSEGDSDWKLLVGLEELRFRFDELTEEQKDEISLKFSDLTEENIAELQKPANDMIAVLEQTNADSLAAEEQRAQTFGDLQSEMQAATDNANDTADHPTYIGEDNYVYEWDKAAKSYNKTSVYVRGEAFSIKKVYASVDEMYADTATTFKEGDFCLINTGSVEDEETAQLFVRTSIGGWDFVVDMSGAVGFTGKTPQLYIGTVTAGNGKASAAVTLTQNGTDTDGNPQYLVNYVIPCLAYEDLTEEQIAELQRPASDMIAQLQTTDTAVKEAEALRVAAEEERVEEFARLKSESETATSGANTAAENANAARDAANEAAQSATDSANAANTAAENANEATAKADTATLNADAAAESANSAASTANASAQRADEAAQGADAAASGADLSATKADTATLSANTATSEANAAKDAANAAAQRADESADKADSATSNANAATDAANTAALKARNLPIIQDGTWWLYDVDTDAYVDSGYAVSSDFQLTREKIENVYTGNITSHWHDRYVDKVEGKQLSTEDFTTSLKEKLDSLGNYDDTELSGAVEKLRTDFDTLVGGDTSDAIESFNEVVAFLEGVGDTQSLSGIIASIEQQIGEKADSTDLPTKVSQLENDVPYATFTELSSGLSSKQPTIEDLEEIRSGAALGATSLQSVPDEYVTDTELQAKGYATSSEVEEGLAKKQEKNLYFNGLTASEWVEDSTYADFPYRCDLPCEGVTSEYYAEVVFGMEQFTSPDYAPICETGDGEVSIWSALNEPITVPTVIVYK